MTTREQHLVACRRGLFTAALAALLFMACAVASASDLYVDNVAGDDLFDGSSPQSITPDQGPYRTLFRALRAALPGDRIILAKTDQPYRESVSLVGSRHSDTLANKFTIEGNGAVLDGSRPVPQWAWQSVGDDVFCTAPPRKQFQQLFLDGLPAARVIETSSLVKLPRLEPKQWALVGGAIYFRVEPGKLPQDYPLSYTALPVGLTLYKVHGVVIRDLVIQGFQLDGINLHDATGPCLLEGLTLRGNGRSGVAIVGASQVDVHSCLIGNNGLCQMLVEDYSCCRLFNCDVLDNSGPKWQLGSEARLLIDDAPVSKE